MLDVNNDHPVLIAGGGIGGLALAMTCHSIGVPVQVLEAVDEVKALGVGINLQPNAVRELQDLGLGQELADLGVETANYAMYSKFGGLIWSEARGLGAGYKWPQYSVHRGELQMLLYRAAVDRLGSEAIRTSAKVMGYRTTESGVVATVADRNGNIDEVHGALLIGCDGIHSAIRAQMYPDEGDALWSGRILWRATTKATPFLDAATMVLHGHEATKLVSYPITKTDPLTGEATLNWIAERSFDLADGYRKEDYTREATIDLFLDAYEGWAFPWLDEVGGLLALLEGAERIYEYPMVDRDPLPAWTDQHVTLLGDAAHVMYPVGSNGASQAIVDARRLGRSFLDHGVGPVGLQAYEDEMRPATNKMVLTNRSAGPDHIMQIVEDRCGGVFDDVHEVMSHQELSDFAAKYKTTAGFAIDALNASPPIIPAGATL